MRKIISGIYFIRNVLNNHLYVGSSKDMIGRKSVHWKQLRDQKHHCRHLQSAWNKYGEENFVFEPITVCCRSRPILLMIEQFYLDVLEPEYNSMKTAGSRLERPNHPGYRGNGLKGKKFPGRHAQRCREMAARRKGIPLTEEHKKKVGRPGVPKPDGWGTRLSKKTKGVARPWSRETMLEMKNELRSRFTDAEWEERERRRMEGVRAKRQAWYEGLSEEARFDYNERRYSARRKK